MLDVQAAKELTLGSWDSSNLIDIKFENSNGKILAKYKLTCSVIIIMQFNKNKDEIDLSGTVTRSVIIFIN